jgi:porin
MPAPSRHRIRGLVWLGLLAAWPFAGTVRADDPVRGTSITGFVAAGQQVEALSGEGGHRDGGLVSFQVVIDHRSSDRDRFQAQFGFAAGKGLNAATAFWLPPWAAYGEDDLKNINGRNRDYLLTAWYRRVLWAGDGGELALTGGIIDGTHYLDENAFANDEYTQFMNAALVNAPSLNSPSYDVGGALELDHGMWSLRSALIEVGENDQGRSYRYLALQVGIHPVTSLGAGNLRLGVHDTDPAFAALDGSDLVPRRGIHLSVDQELGPWLGVWLRAGTQEDKAVIDHGEIVAGGLNFTGDGWGRAGDNIGLGLARLKDGNADLTRSEVAEAYYRLVLDGRLAATLDVQYMRDTYVEGRSLSGWIFGTRIVADF